MSNVAPISNDEMARRLATVYEANVLRNPLTEAEAARWRDFVAENWVSYIRGGNPKYGTALAWKRMFYAWRETEK